MCLARFDFVLHYHPGKSIEKPNALSQKSDYRDGSWDNENVVLLKPKLLTVYALERIAFEGKKKSLLANIWKYNRLRHHKKPMAKTTGELWQYLAKSMYLSEWSEINSLLLFCSKIYILDVHNLYQYIVSLHHNIKITGHAGYWKTLELISWSYLWSQISRYAGQYVSSYNLCFQIKPIWCLPLRELFLLAVPNIRWNTISVNFVVKLSESSGYNTVMMVIDSVSKRVYFIPTYITVTMEGTARVISASYVKAP